MNTTIPVQNIYYLFLYAWNKFQEGKSLELNLEDSPDIPNLFSNIFVNSLKRLIKRGLYKNYKSEINELQYPKYNYRVRAFNNSVLITGTLMGEKGMSQGQPIMFYEYV